MSLPIPLAERVTALEAHAHRTDEAITLIHHGRDLSSEDVTALRGELGEFREEVAGQFTAVNRRLDRQEAMLRAILRHLGAEVPAEQ